MHFLLGVLNDESVPQPTGADLDTQMAQIDAVNEDMKAKGIWVFGGGLMTSDRAAVVRDQSGVVTTTDGPFAETKEQLGGFWVIEVPDRDAALAWAGRCAVACWGPIEVRPFIGLA
ncbi:YciI family protein [Pseudonocardia sp. TRM90224]|uniref:YciI family protein n=1 Tax=Pseudonocardia sp. TRM90224 TaxID=2812678 RepID=UPI001E35E239|nr:YciI family protein [Pseudonocardia sp. TRM90224]